MELLPYDELMTELRRKRKDLGIRQKELARRASITPSQLNKMERGTTSTNYETVYKVWRQLQKVENNDPTTAHDVMNEPVITFQSNDEVRKVQEAMQKHGYSQIPVVDNGSVVGTVTESDLIDVTDGGTWLNDVMSDPLPQVRFAESIKSVRTLLEDNPAVIVYNENASECAGIITEADLITFDDQS